jgi:hypothetical protein
MAEKLPYMNGPCADCQFRKDSPQGWLGAKRMTGILQSDSFVCHKTTQKKMENRRQCAGHMIIKGDNNHFVRRANRLRIPLYLRGQDLIFEKESDCIKHHGL